MSSGFGCLANSTSSRRSIGSSSEFVCEPRTGLSQIDWNRASIIESCELARVEQVVVLGEQVLACDSEPIRLKPLHQIHHSTGDRRGGRNWLQKGAREPRALLHRLALMISRGGSCERRSGGQAELQQRQLARSSSLELDERAQSGDFERIGAVASSLASQSETNNSDSLENAHNKLPFNKQLNRQQAAAKAPIAVAAAATATQLATSAQIKTAQNDKTHNKPTGGRYLISELSWRLVRRCARTKAVRFAKAATITSNKDVSVESDSFIIKNSSSSSNSNSSSSKDRLKWQTSGADRNRKTIVVATGVIADSSSSSMASSALTLAAPAADNSQINTKSHGLTDAADSGNNNTTTAIANSNNNNNSNNILDTSQPTAKTQLEAQVSPSNLRHSSSSISTLASTSATPHSQAGCCFCDQSSSSGFISASTTSGIASACSDSLTCTHSCSSSAYNEPLASSKPLSHHQQQQQSPASNPNTLATPTVDTAPALPEVKQTGKKSNKGGSFLKRARDSTMNLASLAQVTRFSCSASMGNLWSSAGGQQRRELAELSGDSQGVRPLDYVARAQFDQSNEQINQDSSNNNNNKNNNINISNKNNIKPASPDRKSVASKEKRRRQRELEKVEKLRLLVSYLRSGSGQQLSHPYKTSAWTNPQNLATWIDNEVNSLVNDLEAKSQLVENEKHVKHSSKRKWLSGSDRRNSSGAHST